MKQCSLCGRHHSIQKVCNFQDLALMVTKLRETNSMIPQILAMNKEATILAHHYQYMLQKADEAHTILMGILESKDCPTDGLLIKDKYMEALDAWAKTHLPPSTEGPNQLELLTSQGTETKDSTNESLGSVSQSGS